jgi:hypothetical protein
LVPIVLFGLKFYSERADWVIDPPHMQLPGTSEAGQCNSVTNLSIRNGQEGYISPLPAMLTHSPAPTTM